MLCYCGIKTMCVIENSTIIFFQGWYFFDCKTMIPWLVSVTYNELVSVSIVLLIIQLIAPYFKPPYILSLHCENSGQEIDVL